MGREAWWARTYGFAESDAHECMQSLERVNVTICFQVQYVIKICNFLIFVNYVINGEKVFADVVKIRTLRWGDDPGLLGGC